MFVIVMNRSVIICSVFLSLVATVSCKSIGRNDENATASASIPEASTENLTLESSLLTPPRSNDETKVRRIEDLDCSSFRNQKTKRCQSLLQKDPRSQLISLKTPNSAVQPHPTEDRRFVNLGATLSRSPGRTRIIEDDDYICYCRQKNNPLSRKNGHQPELTRRNKPGRRPNNNNMLPGESRLQQRPLYLHQPYMSDGLHQYLPNLFPGRRKMNSFSRNRGGPPYVYQLDSSSLLPSQGQSPMMIKVPINPIGRKHDSIVGQQTPGAYQQSVEQRCPPNNSASRQNIPAASSETVNASRKPSGQRNTAGDANLNLPSVKNSPKTTENVAKDNSNLVGAVGPANNVEEEMHSKTEAYGRHLGDDEYGFYTTSGSVEEKTDLESSLDGSTENPLEDDLAGNKNFVLGNSNPSLQKDPSIDDLNKNDSVIKDNAAVGPLPQEGSLIEDPKKDRGNSDPSKNNSANDENTTLGQSNPLPQEESLIEDPKKDRENSDPSKNNSANDDNTTLGQSNPLSQEESLIEDPKKDRGNSDPSKNNSANDENTTLGQSNPLPQEVFLIEDLEKDPEKINPSEDVSANKENAKLGQNTTTPNKNPINSDPDTLNKNPRIPMANDNRTDDPESFSVDPVLTSDVGDINHSVTPGKFFTDYTEDPLKINLDSDKVDARITDPENQEGLANDSSMSADVTPSSRNNENLVNWRETVGAGKPAGIPEQTLPFCDNSLLEKSIKTVINNFAAENDGDMGQEMLDSARDDLLKEIVDVPNLKGILSLPEVEQTILDKVKNMLAKVTSLPRSKFDGEWPTSVIRNNLRHSLAAAPSTNTELPPNTVEEMQFKDGKWVSSYVTLVPMLKNEDEDSDDDERMKTAVNNLLRNPAVGLEAANHPIVQNIIVQSVHNMFQNSSSDLIQSVLDNELNLMELEDVETTTANETTGQTQANDLEDIDMNKLLEIAKNAAGVTESGSTSTQDGLPEGFTDRYKDSKVGSALSTQKDAPTELPGDIADQKGTSLGPDLSTDDAVPSIISSMTESPSNFVGATNDPRITKNPGLSSTSSATQQSSPKTALNPENLGGKRQESITENPCEVSPGKGIADTSSGPEEDPENVEEEVVGMRRTEEATPDYSYLGKIPVTKNKYSDDIESLQNSELFYVGDGVKLPLEIRRQSDGSYALSISRKVCDHLLDKYCPCCVPLEGNVVREGRRVPKDEEEAVGKKKISKRESISAGSVDSDYPDSADDSLQISMPVKTFARRYNLSLNLRKLQAPWNFAKKTDELEENGATNFGNRDSGNANLRGLLAIHGVAENEKSKQIGVDDSYRRNERYERNIDEKVNKRVEIVTDVLYWLRDMILSARA